MSNGARHRKISRLRPRSEKRTHQRIITARFWAVQRMAAAAAEELEAENAKEGNDNG